MINPVFLVRRWKNALRLQLKLQKNPLGKQTRKLFEGLKKLSTDVITKKCRKKTDKKNVTFIGEGFIQKRRQRSSLLFGEQNLFNSLPRYRYFAPG